MDKKTYIHGRGNVHESQLGIHTWSNLCQRGQCGHNFNVVFITLRLPRKIFKVILLLIEFMKYEIEIKWFERWYQKWGLMCKF